MLDRCVVRKNYTAFLFYHTHNNGIPSQWLHEGHCKVNLQTLSPAIVPEVIFGDAGIAILLYIENNYVYVYTHSC